MDVGEMFCEKSGEKLDAGTDSGEKLESGEIAETGESGEICESGEKDGTLAVIPDPDNVGGTITVPTNDPRVSPTDARIEGKVPSCECKDKPPLTKKDGPICPDPKAPPDDGKITDTFTVEIDEEFKKAPGKKLKKPITRIPQQGKGRSAVTSGRCLKATTRVTGSLK